MSAKQPLVGVGVIIARGHKVLVGKRLGKHGGGQYALPGGHLDFGETLEQCAIREVAEETGLQLHTVQLQWVTNTLFPSATGKTPESHYVTIFMRGDVDKGAEPQNLEPAKCEGWIWADWPNIPEPVFPPLKTLLEDSNYKPVFTLSSDSA